MEKERKMDNLKQTDREIFDAIEAELHREQYNLELIASENVVSRAVLEAAGSILTNKYAEGYPGNRYYGGCSCVDVVESLAIERLKQLFGAEHANVQPHCGANANTAVYLAALSAGDTVMGMSLDAGGHLTHGAKVNLSGQLYNFVPYGTNEAGFIDYAEVERIALDCRPRLIVAGASAYPRIIDFARFRDIAVKAGALLMVDMAHIAGLVAAGIHPSPVPYADFVTSTTHKTLRGPRGGVILCKEKYAKAIDKAVFPGSQGGPLEHIIAAKAVAFKEALTPEFARYQRQIVANCKAMERALHRHGINMVSGGTDNHLLLINLVGTGVTGKGLERLLDAAHITVNKNSIPNDPEKPTITSGIRIGTAVLTTRGMKEPEMAEVIDLLVDILRNKEEAIDRVKAQVIELCKRFPIYS
jgi:glycine hydroxymethyltransferase